jgi:DNA polymerase-1
MEQRLIVIDRSPRIGVLIEEIKKHDVISFDTETTGLTTQHEIIGYSVCFNDHDAYYVALASWEDGKLTYLEDMREASQPLITLLSEKQLIMHNAVFDCMMVESFFKVKLIDALHTDTMVLAHLLNENRRIGLKELAKEYFGEDAASEQAEMKESALANGAKLTKETYEMYKADYKIMGKYGAKDALLTFKLFHIMIEELIEQGLDRFFYTDESMPLLKNVTYELNTSGLLIDIQKLQTLKKTLQAECLEAKDFVMQEITPYVKEKYPGTNKKNTFNLGSNPQMAWLMFWQFKLEFGTLTDGGKEVCRRMGLRLPYTPSAKRTFIDECLARVGEIYQPEALVNGKKVPAKKIKEPWSYIACDKSIMKKHSNRYKWIEVLLEHNRKLKLLSTYVEGIESRIAYGVIRPQFLQTGTTSGRYASRNPNFQNLPRDDKRIKECVISRPGKVFVGADYSQLEPRVFAYMSQDKRLMEAFNGTDDFYSVIGMEVYDKTDCTPQKEGSSDAFGVKYKRLRDLSKVIALASTYGATAHQLAPTTGKSIEDTQADIDNYFERFPGVRQMMLVSHTMAKTSGQVKNLFGRPRRMPEAKRISRLYGNVDHADLPYDARNLLNLAVNHRIQSTGASIVNRAAIQFKMNSMLTGIENKIVCQVHDSLIIECNTEDAESISLLLQDAMENTSILEGIPLEAVPKIGTDLSKV